MKSNPYPVDSRTRKCCGGIGSHTQDCGTTLPSANDVGGVENAVLRLRERFLAVAAHVDFTTHPQRYAGLHDVAKMLGSAAADLRVIRLAAALTDEAGH